MTLIQMVFCLTIWLANQVLAVSSSDYIYLRAIILIPCKLSIQLSFHQRYSD